MSLKSTSRFLSLVLRHKPEAAGLTLDEHGWADVDELIRAVARKQPFDRAMLEEIVRTDSKQRYSFDDTGRKIRANQGHSIAVDVDLEQKTPPEILYHGTSEKSVSSIERQGLLPCGRLYVHLSSDEKTAKSVGARHGRPVIYKVLAGEMARNGIRFFLSANGVWLVSAVPAQYLERI